MNHNIIISPRPHLFGMEMKLTFKIELKSCYGLIRKLTEPARNMLARFCNSNLADF